MDRYYHWLLWTVNYIARFAPTIRIF